MRTSLKGGNVNTHFVCRTPMKIYRRFSETFLIFPQKQHPFGKFPKNSNKSQRKFLCLFALEFHQALYPWSMLCDEFSHGHLSLTKRSCQHWSDYPFRTTRRVYTIWTEDLVKNLKCNPIMFGAQTAFWAEFVMALQNDHPFFCASTINSNALFATFIQIKNIPLLCYVRTI